MAAEDVKIVDKPNDQKVQKQEPVKPKNVESDFDKLLERSKLNQQVQPLSQTQSKTITEEAIKESAKNQDQQKEDHKKDREEEKDVRETNNKREQKGSGRYEQRVVAKGKLKGESGFSEDKGRRDGYGQATARRELNKALTKLGTKSVPVDLQSKFSQKMLDAMKNADPANKAALTQQALNKIVQMVRIGINSKGDKEMRIDLAEKIFNGLKLKVSSHEGRVCVHMLTKDKDGRKVLEKNSEAIKTALKNKGIDVDEFVIS